MTREQYLELKQELKVLSGEIRGLKYLFRSDQSALAKKNGLHSGKRLYDTLADLHKTQHDYRTKHIFMSLLRGKTREQIENNFNSQEPKSGLYSRVEKRLKVLCEQYNLEYDVDENYKVISITRTWIKENAA